jgi:apolipoprotein N-acyltransferase
LKSILTHKLLIYVIPFLLGLFTSFSLPPYNFLIINFITFPTLLFFLTYNYKKSKWISFKIGWLFGFGYFISNLYWITNSLTFEEIFKPLIPFALIIIPLFLGIFYGLGTLICSFFNLKKNFSTVLIFSVIFSLIEFIRGFVLGGFPWNIIVYSWTNYLNSIQILSLIGTYSLNLISITIFLLPFLVLFQKEIKLKIFIFIFLLFVLIGNAFYGYKKIKNDEKFYSEFKDFKIKIISPKISIDSFFEVNNEGIIIEELIELSNPNISHNTIFVFPEGALAGVNLNKLKSFKEIFLKKYSDKHIIIMGINTEEEIGNSSKIYNSMVVLDNNLNLINEYNKIKLVPFGEFLPFENFFKKIGLKKVGYGYESFSAGNKRKSISLGFDNLNFIPLICYEIIYSGKVSLESGKANFIINISEDGWFGDSIGPQQHFSHTIFRAIEEGKNIIRSANNGISAYIDSNGLIISKLESNKKGVIEINNYKKFSETLFSKFGNKIFFYIVLIYIGLIFIIKRWKNK